MRTIRARLAVGYAIAMAATMAVFAGTIYLLRPLDPFTQLDQRIKGQADLIADILTEAHSRLDLIVNPRLNVDLTGLVSPGRPALHPDIAALLASVQVYVVVVDVEGEILYTSEAPSSVPTNDQLEQLAGVGRNPPPLGRFALIDLGQQVGEVRYYVRPVTDAGPTVASIVAGVPTAGLVPDNQRLSVGMLVAGPLILVASIIVGYVLAGHNMKPVDTIIDEIEAITDGRSLHRRVVEAKNTEELARLTGTLNAMLVRLERNFLSLRRFTADASHELKTPLTVLRAGVEHAITHPSSTPAVMESLEQVLVELNRMTEIVDSLLTLARVDEGRAPLHLEPVDFREILSEISETASMLGEQATVIVSVEIPERRLILPLDRGRARQLLLNLLTNAIKYTPKDGSVTITCDSNPEGIVVQVVDTGVGIAASDLPHIFDRFWRADAARTRSARPGSGLGLAICKWIAEAHGGSISVKSRRGKGTTFSVMLPADADREADITRFGTPLADQARRV